MAEDVHVEAGKVVAPPGQIWVCGICGKRAHSKWGFDVEGNSTAVDYGYDTSCMSHAVLCYEERKNGVYSLVLPNPLRLVPAVEPQHPVKEDD